MTDSAIFSLNEATQFGVIAYSYENPSQDDISTLRLIEGGFRTITGQIGEQNRDVYSVETEFATIGIRGTDFSSVIPIPLDPITGLALPATELIAGIFDGGATIATLAAALNIGIGADFSGGITDSTLSMTVLGNANNIIEDVISTPVTRSTNISGENAGFYAGTSTEGKTIALGFLLADGSAATHRELFGKVLLEGDGTATPAPPH
jgi:hypothetical protein